MRRSFSGPLPDNGIVTGWALVTTAVITAGCRMWNSRFPAIGRPATVEEVRTAVRSGQRALREVRERGAAVDKMRRTVERQIADTRRQVQFAGLCSTHRTSFRCADLAYANYTSVRSSTDAMSRLATRARASAAPRIVPLRDPTTGRRHRGDHVGLREGETALREVIGALDAEVRRRLDDVSGLNRRTADLRDTIRDNCGRSGQRWYRDLVERRERARAAEA